MGHPEGSDPGAVKPDPARRPGQPGAQSPPESDTPASDNPLPAGRVDERQIPVDRIRAEPEPPGDPQEPAPDSALSDGSMKSGPV